MEPTHRLLPDASVVLVTMNGRDRLERALASLDAQVLPPARVIVVDNGSRDGTPKWLERDRPNVEVIALPANLGFAAAVNLAVERVTTPYVALLNDDAQADPRWLSELVAALEGDQGAGSAAARMLSDPERDVLDGAGDVVYWSGRVERRGRGEVDVGQYAQREHVASACAGAALYRRAAWAAVGGFEESFFAYHEDVECGLRAQLAGWTCVYVPEAVAYHAGAATSGTNGRPDPYFDALDRRNTLWTMAACFPRRALLSHAPSILLHQILGLGASIRDRRLRSHLRGTIAALRGWPGAWRRRRTIAPDHPERRARLAAVVRPDSSRALLRRLGRGATRALRP
jgi:GT2 family glycosyltransferase